MALSPVWMWVGVGLFIYLFLAHLPKKTLQVNPKLQRRAYSDSMIWRGGGGVPFSNPVINDVEKWWESLLHCVEENSCVMKGIILWVPLQLNFPPICPCFRLVTIMLWMPLKKRKCAAWLGWWWPWQPLALSLQWWKRGRGHWILTASPKWCRYSCITFTMRHKRKITHTFS